MATKGTGTLSTLGDRIVTMAVDFGGAAIVLTGTWVGTVIFEGTVDGVTWAAIPGMPLSGGAPVTTATANGSWQFNCSGLQGISARLQSALTSGTVEVEGRGSGYFTAPGPQAIQCFSFIPDATDELLISASARKLWGVDAYTIDATPIYVKLYDVAVAPTEADTPIHRTGVPANASAALGSGNNKNPWPHYIALTNGLGVRAVVGIADNDDTVLTTAENIINVYWST